MEFPSKLLEQAVNEFSRLPGIGQKTALRLVLQLLRKDKQDALKLGNTLNELVSSIQYCSKCHNISDQEVCHICSNQSRRNGVLCIVEDLRDVMAIENTGQFLGTYHILGGVISPMDGIGPDDLNIESLFKRIHDEEISEVIMALSATIEGDTTIFFLSRKLRDMGVKISLISRGIAVGGELEYADEITLGRAISSRIPYAG